MKNNTKGFTLIELLAVIVILAIIALIATPIVLNLIEKARKGAAESSAYAYIKAVEQSAVSAMVLDASANYAGYTCTVDSTVSTKLSCTSETAGATAKELNVEVKGDLPTSTEGKASTLTFDAKGSVSTGTLYINGYTVAISADGKATAE